MVSTSWVTRVCLSVCRIHVNDCPELSCVLRCVPAKKEDGGCPFDDSLTNMQWLERCDAFQTAPADDKSDKENRTAAAVLEGRPHMLHSVPEAACGSLPKVSSGAPLQANSCVSGTTRRLQKDAFNSFRLHSFRCDHSQNNPYFVHSLPFCRPAPPPFPAPKTARP